MTLEISDLAADLGPFHSSQALAIAKIAQRAAVDLLQDVGTQATMDFQGVPVLSQIETVSGSGDSFLRLHQGMTFASTPSCSSGVITCSVTAHGLTTGSLINATGAAQTAANVVRAAITRVDANTFTYPAPGCPNGNITAGAASFSVTSWTQPTLESIFEHLNGMSGGGLRLVQNASHPGHTIAAILATYDTTLAPYPSHLHIHDGYFNSMNTGVTVDAACADVQAILIAKQRAGALCAMVSALPVPAGVVTWSVPGGMTDELAAAWVVRFNKAMQAFCIANRMLFIDIYSLSAGAAPGYALAGVCKAADFHPSYKTVRSEARLLYGMVLAAGRVFKKRVLTVANIGADATASNICRAAPSAIGAGGSVGSGVTNAYTAWATGAIVALRWRTSNGNLYYTAAGGTATTGNAPTHTRGTVTTADGIAWLYAGRELGTAGVPASWGVFGDATCLVHSALIDRIDRADGTIRGKALRAIGIFGENTDQVRLSYTGTADVLAGDTISSAIRVTAETSFNGANASLSGQNVKSLTAQFVVTVDGVTYTFYGRRGGAGAADEMQADDVRDEIFTVADALIPAGTVTLARWDVIAISSGVGAVSFEVSDLTVDSL
jgi:hypothetical protein